MGAFPHHLFRALGGYVQKWTKRNIPNDCQVLHDFSDSSGAVPASPVDSCGIRNDIIAVNRLPSDVCGLRNDIIAVNRLPGDVCGLRNDIIAVEVL